MEYIQTLLDQIGLGGARVQMFNLSSAQGPQFAQYCTEFSNAIVKLGPNPLRTSDPVKSEASSTASV